MTFVAATASLVILGLALIHAYWGVGGRWPGTDEASMVERVVGRTAGMKAPGPVASFFVALSLLIVAGLVAARAGLVPAPPSWKSVLWIGLAGATFVFLARGVAGYIPAAFRYAEGTPFHRLNRILYSPLCLVLGGAMLWILAETGE